MKTALFSCLLAAITLTAPASAQSTDPLTARTEADRAFLDRVRMPSGAAAVAMQDTVRVRLAELDSTFDMLVAAGRTEAALAFASAMNAHWTRLTDYATALARFQRALALHATPSIARATALRQAAFLAFRQGHTATARALYQEMSTVATQLADTANMASAHGGLARVAARAGNFNEAIQHAEVAARVSNALRDPRAKIGPYHVLAFANRLAGRYEAAARIYEYTIGLYGISGNANGAAGEMFNLGFVRLHQGDTTSAARLFRESLTALRASNSSDQMYLLGAFAALAVVQHQPRRAASLYGAMDAALERARIILDPDDQGEMETYSGIARRELGASAFDAKRQEGRGLPLPDAVALALSPY